MSEWKPIETAPRDGSLILGWGSYQYPGDVDLTEYYEIIYYSGDPKYPWSNGEDHHQPDVFSHWQHLPPKPL